MKILVTGSAGHLGEALVRTLRAGGKQAVGLDVRDSAYTDAVGWQPVYDFRRVMESIGAGKDPRSPLSRAVGSKGYHAEAFSAGPYPVERSKTVT